MSRDLHSHDATRMHLLRCRPPPKRHKRPQRRSGDATAGITGETAARQCGGGSAAETAARLRRQRGDRGDFDSDHKQNPVFRLAVGQPAKAKVADRVRNVGVTFLLPARPSVWVPIPTTALPGAVPQPLADSL